MVADGEILGVLHLQCDPDHGGDAEADQKSRESLKRLAAVAASQIGLSLANLHLREALRDQSIPDPLTGLFNRRFMQESLNKELQRSIRKRRSLAIIFLDLDHFKHFNDAFGHDAGDSVLKSMADIFRVHFRTDDIICRKVSSTNPLPPFFTGTFAQLQELPTNLAAEQWEGMLVKMMRQDGIWGEQMTHG
jgi:GAF domain-containing protein